MCGDFNISVFFKSFLKRRLITNGNDKYLKEFIKMPLNNGRQAFVTKE